MPDDLTGALIRYESEPAALEAVNAGVIAGYYVISPNYLRSGGVTYYRKNYDPMGGMDQSGVIVRALDYNILQDDPQLLARYNNTLVIEQKILSPEPQRDPANMLTFFLPYGVTMLFYFMILGSSSLMLSSINKERENRVLEILMTSVNPMQMLTGKILALGVAGLTQTVVWVGVALLLLRFSGTAFNLGAAFQLPASFLVWGVIFFLLGYALYAAMMASVGALVSNVKEGSSITTLIILPLIVPLVFISGLVQNPNDGISRRPQPDPLHLAGLDDDPHLSHQCAVVAAVALHCAAHPDRLPGPAGGFQPLPGAEYALRATADDQALSEGPGRQVK